MINFCPEDVYNEEELEKMSLSKKRSLALEKMKWVINVYLRDKKNAEYADVDYIFNYIKSASEEGLDNVLTSKYAYEGALSDELKSERFNGEVED